MKHAAIIGVGSYLPERRLTNADLERMVDTSDEWILSRTGIAERRIVADGEATSDMAAEAGRRALADAGADRGKVDLLIVATSTPDMIMPSASALAAAKIGLTCPAIDVNAACTGFIYALQLGASAIESGRAKKVLVIGADTLSSIVDYTDRSTCILFGDGAGALLLRAAKEPGVLGIHLGADGNGSEMLQVPSSGSAAPPTPERLAAHEQFIVMNGTEIFKFAVRKIPLVTKQALRESRLTVQDIDWLVPHQANQRIIDTIAERLGVPDTHVVSTIRDTGNTSAASIPLAIDALYTGGRLRPGQTLALVGFGAGLTWGAAIVRWTKEEEV